MIRLDVKNYNLTLTEKQQKYQQIEKYEYLTCEETLPSDQNRIIEKAKFTYYLLGKAFEKQTKIIEEQGKKQVKTL